MSDTYFRDAAAVKAWQESRFGYLPRTWWLDPSWAAVRLARVIWKYEAKGSGLKARLCSQLNSILTGADIESDCRVGDGLLITFPLGTAVFLDAGENLTIQPLSGAGSTLLTETRTRSPTLGSGVIIESFSGCNGNIAIGDSAHILPGVGVTKSVPAGMFVDRRYEDRLEPLAYDKNTAPPGGADTHHREDRVPKALQTALVLWKSDVERIREQARHFCGKHDVGGFAQYALLNQSIALFVHRYSHACHLKGWGMPARLLASVNRYLFKLTLPAQTSLGEGALLPHLPSSVIRGIAGARLNVLGNASMLNSFGPFGPDVDQPRLGDDVLIAAHGGAFDRARIGNRASVSRKTNVHDHLPADVTAFGKGVFTKSVATFAPARRTPQSFSLPPPSVVRERDRAARLEYETRHGRLPLQSRLAVRLFRKSQRAWMEDRLRASRFWWLICAYLTGANISARSAIAPGLVIVCSAGVNFDGQAGQNLLLTARCFVGGLVSSQRTLCETAETPQLGDNIVVKPHVTVYGGCIVGDWVVFEPGSSVREDIAPNTRVQPPGIRIQKRAADAS